MGIEIPKRIFTEEVFLGIFQNFQKQCFPKYPLQNVGGDSFQILDINPTVCGDFFQILDINPTVCGDFFQILDINPVALLKRLC